MIEWIKGMIFLYRQYRKQKRLDKYIYKSKEHALLALAYWKKSGIVNGFRFQIHETGEYIEIGIDVNKTAENI